MNDDYEDQEEQLGKRFEDLCVDLCIEGTVKEQAWDKYKEVSNNYCIDGDQLQWLVCALYECVRKSTTDNINSLDNTYVSLDRLLSASKMSFVQFFHRIRKWADMIRINEELRDRIERIENQFSVSSVIYDKFCDAFYSIFQKYDDMNLINPEDKNKVYFTDEDLFRFSWIFYVKIKTNFPAICGDIILSFQLLLCSLDWIASNAIISKIKFIFNSKFKGLPTDFLNRNWKPIDRFPTVLKAICETNDMNYIECKSVRDSFFRHYVEKLIEKEVLRGTETQDDNVLSRLNFDVNSRALLNLYGEYMMASGDFDERIYLNPNAGEEIGSIVLINKSKSNYKALNLKSDLTNAVRYMQEVVTCGSVPGSVDTRKSSMVKGCPGRFISNTCSSTSSGVISKLNGGINFNNYDSRVMNSNYLMTLLGKRQAAPTEELTDMLQTHCFPSPMQLITERIEKLSQDFLMGYSNKYIEIIQQEDLRVLFQKKQYDPAMQRCQTIHILYYFALENILKSEVSKIESRYKVQQSRNFAGSNDHFHSQDDSTKLNTIDISGLLKKNEFHVSLFAICTEIILVSFDVNKHFPWVLAIYELQALHFYKIVEIFLRCVDLPRELVKYFNQVTENIVDSIAWKSPSVLWNDLNRSGKAPSIEEVTPPDRIEQSFKNSNKKLIVETNRERPSTKSSSSMLTSRSRLANTGHQQQQQSSMVSSGVGNNMSGNTSAPNSSHNQHLHHHNQAKDDHDESARAAAHLLSSTHEEDKLASLPLSGSSGGGSGSGNVGGMMSNSGTGNMGVVNMSGGQQHSQHHDILMDSSHKGGFIVRHDSLALFFRQIYYLSSLRLRDLCDRLHINRELMCKIWTTFEHVIVERTYLLKDRCLDQIILCCIYAVTKVASSRLLSFHEIIQMYRMQPQSARHIYRDVLMEMVKFNGKSTMSGSGSAVNENGSIINTESGKVTSGLGQNITDLLHHHHHQDQENHPDSQSIEEYHEIREDIIRFYNNIFLPAVQSFIKPFLASHSMLSMSARVSQQPHLSPMPSRTPASNHGVSTESHSQSGLGNLSRKVFSNKNVFVSPAKSCTLTSSNHHHHHHPQGGSGGPNQGQSSSSNTPSNPGLQSPKRVTFTVNSSPSKELRDINAMIAAAASKMKGGLSFGGGGVGGMVGSATGTNTSFLTNSIGNTKRLGDIGSVTTTSSSSNTVTTSSFFGGPINTPAKRLKFD